MKIDNILIEKIKAYPWTTPALKIKGKVILSPDFVLLFLELEKAVSVAEVLNCSRTTLTSHLKKYLPELFNKEGGEIFARILNLFEHKRCYVCKEVKPFSEMISRHDTADYSCKNCSRAQKKTEDSKRKHAARESIRRANKIQRTPKWADLERIRLIYLDCPEGYHVDHIIPLQGELVSGLHVPENLQYLTAGENLRKSNKYVPQ